MVVGFLFKALLDDTKSLSPILSLDEHFNLRFNSVAGHSPLLAFIWATGVALLPAPAILLFPPLPFLVFLAGRRSNTFNMFFSHHLLIGRGLSYVKGTEPFVTTDFTMFITPHLDKTLHLE